VADEEVIVTPEMTEFIKVVNDIHRIAHAVEHVNNIVTLLKILMSKKADVTSRKEERINHVHKQRSGPTVD
jgi:hypothetical protein